MAASLSGVFNLQSLTDGGALGVNMRLYTYVQGTTTHKVAYTDQAGTISHTYTSDGAGGSYIALNARGELPSPLYLTAGSYDLTLKTSSGSTVWTRRADPMIDGSETMAGYEALRLYVGRATSALLTNIGIKGHFIRDDADTTSADNGGTIIVDASGRRWKRLFDGVLSAKWFGVVGDDVTDDTVNLQKFFDASKDLRGFIPAGVYKITSELSINPQFSYNVEGAAWSPNGNNATTIKNYGTGNAIRINNSPFTQNYDRLIRLANFTVLGNSLSTHGIYVTQTPVIFENLWLSTNGQYGLYLEKAYGSVFKQVVCAQNYRHGCLIDKQGNALHFDHCVFNGNSRTDGYSGCHITGSAGFENLGLVFNACDFTSNGYPGGVTTAYGIVVQYTHGISLIGCYGEANKLRNVYADSTVKGLTVRGSYWQDGVSEIVNVLGLTYENNINTRVTLATDINIVGSTSQRQFTQIQGNSISGGATETYGVGVQQRNIAYANAAPTSGTWNQGDIFSYKNPDQGTPFGWICTAAGTPGTWRPITKIPGTNSNQGDADLTLSALSSVETNLWQSPITANRVVTLSTTGAYAGAKFRIVRTSGATGAFTLDVGTGPLKSLSAGQWCDVEYEGTAWRLVAAGSL